MNLSPYPNLWKAEKIKSTLWILQKNFDSAYLTRVYNLEFAISFSSPVIYGQGRI